jgi:photosystem II stability/assembly factor-like uncharacterized protein
MLLFCFLILGFGSECICGEPISIAERPILDVFFLPTGDGWLVVSDRTREFLLRTRDSGKTWLEIPLKVPIERVYFVDNRQGWAVAHTEEKFSLLRTTDGGATWKESGPIPQLPNKSSILTSLFFNKSNRGWIVGYQVRALSLVLEVDVSTGKVKRVPALSGKDGLSEAIFGDPKSGDMWIVGRDSILYSPNSGELWRRQIDRNGLPEATSFDGGQALGNGAAFVVAAGVGGAIYRTMDHGKHWNVVTRSEESHWFTAVTFWDEGHGCAVGATTLLFCTNDGGNTWVSKNVLPKAKENMVFMDNIFTTIVFVTGGSRGWVLASGGFLYQTDDGGNSWHQFDPITPTK